MNNGEIKEYRLSELKSGEEGVIIKVRGHGSFRKRITEMGFVKGKKVITIKNAPLQDPVEYKIMDYNISLRRSEADLIEVVAPDSYNLSSEYSKNSENSSNNSENKFQSIISDDALKNSAKEKGKVINIALVGNPNSGKTTLYNMVSGAHEKVGNYSGVTVDAQETTVKKNSYTFNIVDLPGTYSITEYTPEELYVRNHIFEKNPDIVVNVVDASNLERNLFLTTQLIDMNIKVVIALNMYDELEKTGARLDYKMLGKMFGIPIVPTVAFKNRGIDTLFEKLIDVYEDNDQTVRHIHINYGSMIEKSIDKIKSLVKLNLTISDKFCARNLAIKLLENDKASLNLLVDCQNFDEIKRQTESEIIFIENEFKEKTETIIADAKYGFIAGALGETFQAGYKNNLEKTAQIDNILTNQLLGFPIFIFFMWFMFQATFTLGAYPMEWIDSGVSALGGFINNSMQEGMFRDLLVDGIIGGVGGVMVFLPNILILFFFISFMEDTGYMARASFIMDKLMHKIGLHGKSFIPLIMGFGCNVPAIMATRTLENKKDRILTMIMIPFMSCSARLPVYVLLISAFFHEKQGIVLASIYFIGVLIAIITALILKKKLFKGEDVPFVMELPPYRIPTLRNTSIHMWHKAMQYLKKMGGVILVASVIIWVLEYFPQDVNFSKNYDKEIETVTSDNLISEAVKIEKINKLKIEKKSEKQEKSYIGRMGRFVEPVIRPLGFDWKIGVSIITGFVAKEIVISTMGVLYHATDLETDETSSLQTKLQEQTYKFGDKKGEKIFSPLVAYGLMIFVLLYFPCIATIAAIRKEANTKWAAFAALYTTSIAWIVSLLIYQIGSLF